MKNQRVGRTTPLAKWSGSVTPLDFFFFFEFIRIYIFVLVKKF
jgi:hypothetical protein